MAAGSKARDNTPEPRPIIVKKYIVEGHGGHHGGAWKVAYADFVTAMMAFFLLMWLLGATTEKQRKSLADYFTPTLVEMKMSSAGSTGLFGGDSIVAKDNYPTTGGQGNKAITIPRDATGTREQGGKDMKSRDRQSFETIKQSIEKRIALNKVLQQLAKNIRFTETREGLRVDVIDQANFSMFAIGTDRLVPQARALVGEVAQAVQGVPNDVIVRGHTDGLPYSSGRSMNNWLLSSARAEATRKAMADSGVPGARFAKIEGVADREPFIAANAYDPRNRRMSIVLAWTKGAGGSSEAAEPEDKSPMSADMRAAIRERDDPVKNNERARVALDLGRTALPVGATLKNGEDLGKSTGGPPKKGH